MLPPTKSWSFINVVHSPENGLVRAREFLGPELVEVCEEREVHDGEADVPQHGGADASVQSEDAFRSEQLFGDAQR